ncbi:hypothetical protein LCGC14_0650200 [marine sediment metagenome]|uniref:Uracil-DNA glycosylase-like domain-containing protein n=1 Tax=marine sediment metagenome TaxID=412755 RepID=A0A0F9TIA1_9ZZZZ|nr:hypothetical protein [Candidatus Aminicenantes bacterium]
MIQSNKQVPDWGDASSRFILIGEAPGQEEEHRGQPFVGASGLKLNEWWARAGLHRGMFYITNVLPFRPWNNDISKVPQEELDYWSEHLRKKISGLPDPFILIPTGKTALRALLGKDNISDLRGSILSYEDGHRTIKMIPTIHPAATFRTKKKKFEARCIYDWMRIAYEGQFQEIKLPKREHYTAPTDADCAGYAASILAEPNKPLAVDIETHPQEGITCVGFAWSKDYSFTIPLGIRRQIHLTGNKPKEARERETKKANDRISKAVFHKEHPLESYHTKKRELNAIEKWRTQKNPLKTICRIVEEYELEHKLPSEPWKSDSGYFITVGYWETEEQNEKAKEIIKSLIEGDNPLIFHHGFYDTYWLTDKVYWLKEFIGCEIKNWYWDTLAMHHCLVPNEEHTLDFLASVYTSEPFWKKETKEAEASGKYYKKQEVLWRYNGKDVAVTFELYEKFLKMLQDSGRMDFYWKHYYNLFEPLLELSLTGIKADTEKRDQRRVEFREELNNLFIEIEKQAGKALHGKIALSTKKVQEYLYEDLKLPKQKRYRPDKKEKTSTADELAIRTLMLRFPEKLNVVGEKILRCQRLNKLLGYLKEAKLDPDGRLRSQYKFNTTTGRLASGSNPYGSGDNAQNQDLELRDIYVAG